MVENKGRSCPLCGWPSSQKILVEQNFDRARLGEYSFSSRKTPELMHHRMVVCSRCDLAYADPIPEVEWIRNEYVNAAFEAGEDSHNAARNHARALHRIMAILPDRKRAIDIGTGDGEFLLILQDAAFDEIIGVEPSAEPVRQASDLIKSCIDQKFFDGNNYESGVYSLVTCFQVLEHVDNVDALAREVFQLLKPGGVFLVVCHDCRSFSARMLGRQSPIFDIEHLQLFSETSLNYLFRNHGFIESKISSFSNVYPIRYWLKIAPINTLWKRWLGRAFSFLRISSLPVPVYAGNLWGFGIKPK